MKFYYDTEFSRLDSRAELISIGIVAASGETFYRELVPLPKRCSDFVNSNVIPQLTGGTVAVSIQEFIDQLADWLSQWTDPVELMSDSTWDIFLLRKTIIGRGSHNVGRLALPTKATEEKSIFLSITPMLHEGKQAVFDSAVLAMRQEGLREHHALFDALTLRSGMEAVYNWL